MEEFQLTKEEAVELSKGVKSVDADLTKALNETTNADGGYTVPTVLSERLLELVQARSVTLADVERIRMTSDNLQIPKVTSGSTAYWVSENNTITASTPQFTQISLVPKKVAALIEITSEVIEDSNQDMMAFAVKQMAEDLALAVDNEILNGDGTNLSGYRDTTTYTSVQTVDAGLDGDPISLSKISEAIEKLESANHSGDIMYVHPKVVKKLRDLVDSNNRPIFDEATFGSPLLKEGVIGTIYGLKVKPTTQLPTNLTKGSGTNLTDIVVIDSRRAGIFGERRQLKFAKSFYDITKDIWKVQATWRVAFTLKYQDAVVIIKDIQTA